MKPLELNDTKTPAFVPTRSKSLEPPGTNTVVLKSPAPSCFRLPVMSVQLAPALVVRNTWLLSTAYALLQSSGSSTTSRTVSAPAGSAAVGARGAPAVVRKNTADTGADIQDILVVYPT